MIFRNLYGEEINFLRSAGCIASFPITNLQSILQGSQVLHGGAVLGGIRDNVALRLLQDTVVAHRGGGTFVAE